MAERIDTSSTPPPRRTDTVRSGSTQQTENRDQPVSEVAATTAVSRDADVTGNLVQRLQEEVAASSEIDRKKVDSVKQAIASGEFVVDPARVASAFIQVEALLA